jgi:hypothetical protein
MTIREIIGVALVITGIVVSATLVSIPLTAEGHGAAAWIQSHPDFSWCCSKHDCNPSPEGAVHWTPEGYSVDGLSGTKQEGERGFYRSPEIDRPWHCAIPGTQRLRCLFMPEGQG